MKEKQLEPPKARMTPKGHSYVKILCGLTGKKQGELIEWLCVQEMDKRGLKLPEQ